MVSSAPEAQRAVTEAAGRKFEEMVALIFEYEDWLHVKWTRTLMDWTILIRLLLTQNYTQ